jgi:hypothetical protein
MMNAVEVGQEWRDNDSRMKVARVLRILSVKNGKALCSVRVDGEETGRRTLVSVQRFRPTSTGYVLL